MNPQPDVRVSPPNGLPHDAALDERWRLPLPLGDRLRFGRLLAQLSATFIHLSADAVDGQIEQSLGQLVDFLGVERSSLAQFSEDGARLLVTHSWSAPGYETLARFDLAAAWPWYTERVRRGEVLCFTRLPDELPAQAVNERAYCARGGPRSHLMIPFTVGAEVIGGIGFGSFRREITWPDELIGALQLVGEVFANALSRKRAEQRTAQLRDQLTRAARVTLLGELAASIAHEVNQPLCAIVSNAQAAARLLAAAHPDVGEARAALHDIAEDGRRASEILARIRASLRQAPPERTPVNLNDLIREVVLLARLRLAGRGVTVSLELPEDLPPVLGDRVQLQQVILNLLVNGADAMDDTPEGARTLIVHAAADNVGSVAVTVADAGAGLAPGEAERMFDAFYTTKPGGMGMGLAICRSIVEAHGGRIAARPNDGPGATVELTFPAWAEVRRG